MKIEYLGTQQPNFIVISDYNKGWRFIERPIKVTCDIGIWIIKWK